MDYIEEKSVEELLNISKILSFRNTRIHSTSGHQTLKRIGETCIKSFFWLQQRSLGTPASKSGKFKFGAIDQGLWFETERGSCEAFKSGWNIWLCALIRDLYCKVRCENEHRYSELHELVEALWRETNRFRISNISYIEIDGRVI